MVQLQKKPKRVQIDMSEKAFARLERLREATDATTFAEVMRQSLETREVIVDLMTQGYEIFAEDKSGNKIRIMRP
jgi:hypothetical protein